MNQKAKTELTRLLGEDEAEEIIKTVDNINETVEQKNLIHLSKEDEELEEVVADELAEIEEDPKPADPVAETVNQEVVIGDEELREIAQYVSDSEVLKSSVVDPITASITSQGESLKVISDTVTKLSAWMEEAKGTLVKLSATDEEKITEKIKDIPRGMSLRVSHRPTAKTNDLPAGVTNETMHDVAQRTLAALGQ